jgi:polyphosphate kinase
MATARAVAAVVRDRRSRRYLNRELSRLDFNARVLAMAEDRDRPLLDRVRFLSIFSRSTDEFFQIRVAGLQEQVQAKVASSAPDGATPAQQLREIRGYVERLTERQTQLFNGDLAPALEAAGIRIRDAESLSKAERKQVEADFARHIFPVLTPLAVDPGHPFPYISHLSLNLAVIVRDPLRRGERFARLKIPPLLPRFTELPDGGYLPLEQVVALNLQALFPGMELVDHHVFRITRDADLDLVESEAEDLLSAIQTELRRRRRQGRAVRLEVDPDLPRRYLDLMVRELELSDRDVYPVTGLLDLGSLDTFADLDRPDLKSPAWIPATQPRLRGSGGEPADLFAVIRKGEVLVEHPYDSFTTSVEAFIEQASRDPKVLAIKQTLYRTSGPASPIARALTKAAELGKQVVALVELKARGDEQANIEWAQALEESGVHVVYGLVGLKTHAKLMLVVRMEDSGIRYYVHIGTGNYNPATAHVYEDVGLLSADPDLGHDVSELFNLLTGYSRQRKYRRLLVAPTTLRGRILELIEHEGQHHKGRITIKVNNLVDPEVIDALYAASKGGAEIDLIVRGICCLRPGVRGLSATIRVRSLVGRFLEHARLFRFGTEKRGVEYYLGSADLMERNLDRRVEAVVPVRDPEHRRRLDEMLELELADDVLAWELGADGCWTKVPTHKGVNSQEVLRQLALERAAGGRG